MGLGTVKLAEHASGISGKHHMAGIVTLSKPKGCRFTVNRANRSARAMGSIWGIGPNWKGPVA